MDIAAQWANLLDREKPSLSPVQKDWNKAASPEKRAPSPPPQAVKAFRKGADPWREIDTTRSLPARPRQGDAPPLKWSKPAQTKKDWTKSGAADKSERPKKDWSKKPEREGDRPKPTRPQRPFDRSR